MSHRTVLNQAPGVIDAAVNGGVDKYEEAFFSPEYIAAHPGEKEKIEKLRGCLEEQVCYSSLNAHILISLAAGDSGQRPPAPSFHCSSRHV